MRRRRLTTIFVNKVKPTHQREEYFDADVPGMALVVQPTGSKSWIVRYHRKSDRKHCKLTLYGLPDLATARQLAREALNEVAKGGDPAAEKKRSGTVAVIAADFMRLHVQRTSTKAYAKATESVFTNVIMPAIGSRRIDSITKADLIGIIDRVVAQGHGVQANRVLSRLKRFFGWALERDIIARNPTIGIKPPTKETPRERVLSDDELARVCKAAEAMGYPYGSLIQMLILTGQRRGEVAGMQWDEIRGDEWHIPAWRMKAKTEHVLPLSSYATTLLATVPRIAGAPVFTATGKGSVSDFVVYKRKLDELSGVRNWVVHDLRRTVATGLARQGAALAVIEQILHHKVGSIGRVGAIYQRYSFLPEMRTALERWGAFIGARL
jgi:integrase